MRIKTAFLFPGQGSQYVGMFEHIRHENCAKDFMDQFEHHLHVRFDSLSDDELQQTQFTQPALYTMSAIYFTLFQEAGILPDFVAGHSLGEFSALYAAGFFSFADGLSIVSIRGKLMQEVSRQSAGKMAAIIGLERDAVLDICNDCSQVGLVKAVNFNAPLQTVISGQPEAVIKACEMAKTAKAKLVVSLPVSAAFHSPYMEPLRTPFREAFRNMALMDAKIPVIQNMDAQPHQQKQVIVENLISQLHSPVLWVDTIEKLIALGARSFVESGPKKVLTGLMKLLPYPVVVSEEWIKNERMKA